MSRPSLSVIVPCHNYASYLGRCLQSILGQTTPPDEIIVVDDDSNDKPEGVVAQFSQYNVRLLRVEYRSPLLARRAGYEASCGEILCFIDADDSVEPFYFEDGLKRFNEDYRIAIVYSDVLFQGAVSGRSEYPPDSDAEDLSRTNFIHCGALVRREALLVADAFRDAGPAERHEDWAVWRAIASCGFRAVKQQSLYRYQKHDRGVSWSRHYGVGGYTYATGAALSEESITVILPLSGRIQRWQLYSQFLNRQLWDHDKIRLLLVDAGDDPSFSQTVREWAANSDYSDVSCLRCSWLRERWVPGGNPDLQLDDQMAGNGVVWPAACGYLAACADTNYVLLLEDDILPPPDICRTLMESFCQDTVSVSAAYSRGGGSMAWNSMKECLSEGTGVQTIAGNGFGCALLRTSFLKQRAEELRSSRHSYVRLFYEGGPKHRLIKINWNARCRTLSGGQQVQAQMPAAQPLFARNLFQNLMTAARSE